MYTEISVSSRVICIALFSQVWCTLHAWATVCVLGWHEYEVTGQAVLEEPTRHCPDTVSCHQLTCVTGCMCVCVCVCISCLFNTNVDPTWMEWVHCMCFPNVCVFGIMVKEGAWEDWCLIGTCCRDLLLPVSECITSSHPAQSYCLAISQSLWHNFLFAPYFFLSSSSSHDLLSFLLCHFIGVLSSVSWISALIELFLKFIHFVLVLCFFPLSECSFPRACAHLSFSALHLNSQKATFVLTAWQPFHHLKWTISSTLFHPSTSSHLPSWIISFPFLLLL